VAGFDREGAAALPADLVFAFAGRADFLLAFTGAFFAISQYPPSHSRQAARAATKYKKTGRKLEPETH